MVGLSVGTTLGAALMTESAWSTYAKGQQGRASAYRWHQVLPVAGAILDEDIAEPEGRSILLNLSVDRPSLVGYGLSIDRVTLRSATDTLVIDDPPSFSFFGAMPPELSGIRRIPAPHASCGERFEIMYDASRYVPNQTVRLSLDPILVPDPSKHLMPATLGVSLLFAKYIQAPKTPQLTDGLSGQLRGRYDVFPSFSDNNVRRRGVHATFGIWRESVASAHRSRSPRRARSKILPWALVGLEGGAGYTLAWPPKPQNPIP